MNNSADAADEVVKMYLQGVEVTARISGTAAKHIAAFLYAVMKDKKQTQGKTKLKNMLKSDSKLKVFSIREKDLKKFTKEAKRYGVLYCLLKDKFSKKNPNRMIDIMVREEDAARINRIVNKFKLSTYDKATVQSDREPNKIIEKDGKQKNETLSNPQKAMTEKDPLSEPSYKNKSDSRVTSNKNKKDSVRKTLNDIKNELKMLGEREDTKESIRSGKDVTVINAEKKTVNDYSMNKNGKLKVRKDKFGKTKTR